MTDVTLLIVALAVQQALFALGWAVGARRLRLSRQASAHFAGFCLATALCMPMFTIPVRDAMGDVAMVLRNVLAVLGFVLLRRGLLTFLRQPLRDAEQWGLFGLFVVAMLPLGTDDAPLVARTLLVSLTLAWVLLRGAQEVWWLGRAEFGPRLPLVVAGPMAAIGVLMVVRSAMAVANPQSGAVSITVTGQFNVVMLLALVALVTLFHFALGLLVTERLFKRLHHLSRHDELTGLLNRRAFDERLLQAVATSRRGAQPLGLLMVDIDHFKRVNDLYGHHSGDQALRWVAQQLLSAARLSDVVGRLGGEEFCVLLPATDAAGIRQAAERLRAQVAARACPLPERAGRAAGELNLTVSVGASMLLAAENDGNDLQRRADQALYRAKAEGRNRVVFDTLAGVAATAGSSSQVSA